MTQEEKNLLLTDLSARLPYGVMVYDYDKEETREMGLGTLHNIMFNDLECKPYLRPMSSMTEEEKKTMKSYGFELISYDTGCIGFANIENYIDEVSFRFMEEFLNSHHFDYRGLIEEGLALEATENMYKTE